MEGKTEMIIAAGGILTTISAYFFGGRQTAKKDSLEVVSDGADKLVDSTLKLVDRLEQYLDQEKEHRSVCEQRLKDQDKKINELERIVEQIGSKK